MNIQLKVKVPTPQELLSWPDRKLRPAARQAGLTLAKCRELLTKAVREQKGKA